MCGCVFNYMPGGVMMMCLAEKPYHYLYLLIPWYGLLWCMYKYIIE